MGVIGQPAGKNYIAALWHNRLLLISFALKKFLPQRPGAGLVSASRDGDLVADLTQRFGFEVVRGSSSRLGASAILELSNVLATGRDILITPDGPRGPAYELGPGIIFLAQKTGAEVVPVNFEYLELLALEKLGPIYPAASFFQGPLHHRTTALGKIDKYAAGIRSRAFAFARCTDVAG